jgi:hypothetical protein
MSFRKPFRAPPVRLGTRYRARQQRAYLVFAGKTLAAAVAGGLLIGALSVPTVRAQLSAASVALSTGRSRVPQVGDHWSGCDDARAAGAAPIYFGEPGYREGMDGDDDGVACEPVRY